MDQSILIAGAGIGGLTLARALQLHGFKPRVFERSAVLESAGAGLAIQPNGISALRVVALDKPVINRGISLQSASVLQSDGRVITEMQMPSQNLDENVVAPMVAIRRSDLHDVLYKAVGDECIRPDAKITKFKQVADRAK